MVQSSLQGLLLWLKKVQSAGNTRSGNRALGVGRPAGQQEQLQPQARRAAEMPGLHVAAWAGVTPWPHVAVREEGQRPAATLLRPAVWALRPAVRMLRWAQGAKNVTGPTHLCSLSAGGCSSRLPTPSAATFAPPITGRSTLETGWSR